MPSASGPGQRRTPSRTSPSSLTSLWIPHSFSSGLVTDSFTFKRREKCIGIYISLCVTHQQFHSDYQESNESPGAITFIIGFTGCVGALRENTGLLAAYAIFLAILLLLEMTAGILGFIFKDWVRRSDFDIKSVGRRDTFEIRSALIGNELGINVQAPVKRWQQHG